MDTHNGSWRWAEWTQTCTHNDSESKLLSQHGVITARPFWTPSVMKCRQLQFFQFSLPCIIHPSVQNSLFVSEDSGVCLFVSQHHHGCVSMNCSTKCSQFGNRCLHSIDGQGFFVTSLYFIGSWSECRLHNFACVQSCLQGITYVTQCLTCIQKSTMDNMPI